MLAFYYRGYGIQYDIQAIMKFFLLSLISTAFRSSFVKFVKASSVYFLPLASLFFYDSASTCPELLDCLMKKPMKLNEELVNGVGPHYTV